MPRSLVSYRTRSRWTIHEARAALSALARSGLSPHAFAQRQGLDAQRLYFWQRRVGAAAKSASAPAFVELRPRSEAPVEIVLRSGRSLRVPASIDEEALARLVRILELEAAC